MTRQELSNAIVDINWEGPALPAAGSYEFDAMTSVVEATPSRALAMGDLRFHLPSISALIALLSATFPGACTWKLLAHVSSIITSDGNCGLTDIVWVSGLYSID